MNVYLTTISGHFSKRHSPIKSKKYPLTQALPARIATEAKDMGDVPIATTRRLIQNIAKQTKALPCSCLKVPVFSKFTID